MFDTFHKLRDLYRTTGPLRFAILFGGVLGFCVGMAALHIWLEGKTGWPRAYGFSCHGRGCWLDDLYHSPQLLKGVNGYTLALFAQIWSIPALTAAYIAVTHIRRRRRRRRDRIRPMD